jgi:hypothetical protein
VYGAGFAGSANFERWWRSLPSNAKKNKKRARQTWKRQRLDSTTFSHSNNSNVE